MSNNFPLQELADKFKAAIPAALDAMGNESINFILDNFRKQGFQGATFMPWPKRKNDKYSKGRAILVQSGRLKRSWHAVKNISNLTTKVSTDVPYAKIHNDGGTINHPARQQVLHFSKQGRFSKVKAAKYGQKVGVGAHTTQMPQRQMIGNSPVLSKKVYSAVQTQFVNVVKNFKP